MIWIKPWVQKQETLITEFTWAKMHISEKFNENENATIKWVMTKTTNQSIVYTSLSLRGYKEDGVYLQRSLGERQKAGHTLDNRLYSHLRTI